MSGPGIWERVEVVDEGTVLRVTLNRPDRRNAVDDVLLHELDQALDLALAGPRCRIVALAGRDGVFCAGMDIEGAAQADAAASERTARAFFSLLRRFTLVPRTVVALVDGQVAGGGVGLTAAADLVYATPRSAFGLPEALWGLLPCCVLPFLMRRVGRHQAAAMALTTLPVSGADAERRGLADAVGPDLDALLRKVAFRADRVAPDSVGDLKGYLSRLDPLPEQTEQIAVAELMRLTSADGARRNFDDFAAAGRFPWEASGRPGTTEA